MGEQLILDINRMLKRQVLLFAQMDTIQTDIIQSLALPSAQRNYQHVIDCLQKKEDFLEQINTVKHQNADVLAAFMQQKEQLKSLPDYKDTMELLNDLERVVQTIREQDVSMANLFSQIAKEEKTNNPGDSNPQNRLNAFRAMR
jgi:hypothetical protein